MELDPTKNYLFAVHPHGVLSISAFTHFTCNGSGFDSVFPGFRAYLTMLPFWFRIPFYRDYIMRGGKKPNCCLLDPKKLIVFRSLRIIVSKDSFLQAKKAFNLSLTNQAEEMSVALFQVIKK